MNFKKYLCCVDILDWISIVCTFALLACICILKWNALSPAETLPLQPEVMLVVTLLLSGLWMNKWKPAKRILPFIGIILVFFGLVILLDKGAWSKIFLCVGMGPILCTNLYKLWQQLQPRAFVAVICCGGSIGMIFVAIPMILNNYHIWPLLTSGLAVGIIVGFLRPDKDTMLQKTKISTASPAFNKTTLNIFVATIWGLSSLGTGVSYKWFFLDVPLPAFIHVILLCTGFCVTGIMLLRLELNHALSLFWGMLVVFNLLQLIAHNDCPFTNAVSYMLFGMYLAGFLFFPLLIWQEDVNAFRIGLGLSMGFICQIIAPRTLSIIAPQNWLFETRSGWILQTTLLVLLFFSFCFFNRKFFMAAFAQVSSTQPEKTDTRNPLPDYFTKREYEVAMLILQGKTNREISIHLNIAESTVKTHIGNLLGKAQCNTKSQFISAYHP